MNTSLRRPFTLIELLVVVAIIAVLASMLLPALTAARMAAKRSDCLNRLKNLNLATMMYRDDNDGYFPMNQGSQAAFGAWRQWHAFIQPYTPLAEHTGSTIQLSAADNYLLCPALPYMPSDGSGDVWGHVRPQGVWYSGVWSGGWVRMVGSYYTSVYYGQMDLHDDGLNPYQRACRPKRRPHTLLSPEQRVLIGEAHVRTSGSVVSKFGYTNSFAQTEYPHRGRTNILALDGSARTWNNLGSYAKKPIQFYTNEEVGSD